MILVALIACSSSPSGTGAESGETTTLAVASFGEDGPTTTAATATTQVDPTSSSETTSWATTTAETDVSTDTTAASTTTGSAESTGSDTGAPICAAVQATIRDFTADYPDMTLLSSNVVEPGLLLDTLDAQRKPIYNPDYAGAMVITSAETFAQWYRDEPGVNLAIEVELGVFDELPGHTVFDSSEFFPIDDLGFGDEGEIHNYFFTTEVHTSIVYQGGEVMSFGGDDDVWVFVDGQLAVDLGGKHSAIYGELALDELGLQLGQSYALDVFHAERGVSSSQLRFELGVFCEP